VIEKGKSEVSLPMEIRFLVKPGTTKTSFKVREEVGEMVPVREMGRKAPLPTITRPLPVLYVSDLSN
jgi:hypothetical protein